MKARAATPLSILLVLLFCSVAIAGYGQDADITRLPGVREAVQYDTFYIGSMFRGTRIRRESYNREGFLASVYVDWRREEYPFRYTRLYRYQDGKLAAVIDMDQDSTVSDRDYYFYNRSGQITRIVSYRRDSSIRQVDSFHYHHAGSIREHYNYFPGVLPVRHKKTEALDASGRPVRVTEYAGGTVETITRITYDAGGRKIKEETTFKKHNSTSTWRYTYDAQGDLLENRQEDADIYRPTLEQVRYLRKDGKGNWLAKQEYQNGELSGSTSRILLYY